MTKINCIAPPNPKSGPGTQQSMIIQNNKADTLNPGSSSGFPLRQYGSQAQGETGGGDSPFYTKHKY